jgi:hypothetical protein
MKKPIKEAIRIMKADGLSRTGISDSVLRLFVFTSWQGFFATLPRNQV